MYFYIYHKFGKLYMCVEMSYRCPEDIYILNIVIKQIKSLSRYNNMYTKSNTSER